MPATKPTTLPRWAQLEAWQASTFYALGFRSVNDSGKLYQVTTAGVSDVAGGPTGTGGAITDGTIVWAYQGANAPAWVTLTAYGLGARVTNNGNTYAAIVAGTSGASGPSGTAVAIVDGSVVWEYIGAATAALTVPTANQEDIGWVPGQRPPAQIWNWLTYTTLTWLVWLQDLTNQALIWAAKQTFNGVSDETLAATAFAGAITNRRLQSEYNTGGSGNMWIRYYAVTGGGLEITANAKWNGTVWIRDTGTANQATKWTFDAVSGVSLQYYTGADGWIDGAWVIESAMSTSGDVAARRNLEASGSPVGSAGPGLAKVTRIYTTGTALANTDFTIGVGWGVGASVTVRGTDQAFEVTVTAAGIPAPNPTLLLTYKDGTYTTVPIADVALQTTTDLTALGVPITWLPSATTLAWTFYATPIAASTYTFRGGTIGI